jgi:hypothetical protein
MNLDKKPNITNWICLRGRNIVRLQSKTVKLSSIRNSLIIVCQIVFVEIRNKSKGNNLPEIIRSSKTLLGIHSTNKSKMHPLFGKWTY